MGKESLPAREIVRFTPALERQQLVVERAKAQVARLTSVYPQAIVERELLEADKPFLQPKIFARSSQAINSLHDIRHGAEVEPLSLFIGRIAHAETGLPLNENVLRMSVFHDVRRRWDLFESAPFIIRFHGAGVARRLSQLSEGMAVSDTDRKQAADVIKIHDHAHLPKAFAQNLTTEALVVADRLTLGRVLYKETKKTIDRVILQIARWGVKKRNGIRTSHINGEQFQDIADALLFLSTQNINAQVASGEKNPDQFQAVIDAAETLGMVKSQENHVQSAQKEAVGVVY